jgi:4a-hydroxytetrahydrobiopterin dehydratase
MPTVLSAEQLASALAELPGWSGDPSEITREVTAPSFIDGIRLVDAVADAAEAADHHPDIDIRWRTVTFRLATHSVGGVTEADLSLARSISVLADNSTAGS